MAEECLQILDNIVKRVCPGETNAPHEYEDLHAQFEDLRAALLQKDADVVTCVEMGQRLLLENAELKGEVADVWDIVHSQEEELKQQINHLQICAQELDGENKQLLSHVRMYHGQLQALKKEKVVMVEQMEHRQQQIQMLEHEIQIQSKSHPQWPKPNSPRTPLIDVKQERDALRHQVTVLRKRVAVEELQPQTDSQHEGRDGVQHAMAQEEIIKAKDKRIEELVAELQELKLIGIDRDGSGSPRSTTGVYASAAPSMRLCKFLIAHKGNRVVKNAFALSGLITTQRRTRPRNTTQHNTTQHNTTQPSPTNTIQENRSPLISKGLKHGSCLTWLGQVYKVVLFCIRRAAIVRCTSASVHHG